MHNVTPISVNYLPVPFLSVVSELVSTFGERGMYADRVRLAHHLVGRSVRIPLPPSILGQAAVELAALSMTVASVGEYFEHFEEIERKVRHITAGIDVALAARVEGQPLFTRYYDHRAMFAERRDAG